MIPIVDAIMFCRIALETFCGILKLEYWMESLRNLEDDKARRDYS